MDSVLITGGAGFVGSFLARRFRQEFPNRRIVVFDNLRRKGSEINRLALEKLGVEFLHGDIRHRTDLNEITGDFELCIEASAEASVLAGVHGSPNYVIETNLGGTINCLSWARKRVDKFFFLSTSRVYSIPSLLKIQLEESANRFKIGPEQNLPGISPAGISENFPTDQHRSFYGASKLASEFMVQEYSAQYGLSSVINRCGVICGPGQFGKVDQGVFTLWVARHFFKKNLRYTGFGGSGKQVRDLLHPEDLFRILIKQLHNFDKVSGQTLNVGGGPGISTSLKELTEICQEVVGNKIEIDSVNETTSVDIPLFITDCRKIQKALGWKPEIDVTAIVSDIFQWIKTNENQLRPIFT